MKGLLTYLCYKGMECSGLGGYSAKNTVRWNVTTLEGYLLTAADKKKKAKKIQDLPVLVVEMY